MSRLIFSLLDRSSYGTLYPALNAAGLPTGDLDEPERRFFELADGDSPIGFVGLEGDGPDLLLRSLIVLPGRKRQGNGGLLVAHPKQWHDETVRGGCTFSRPRPATSSGHADTETKIGRPRR